MVCTKRMLSQEGVGPRCTSVLVVKLVNTCIHLSLPGTDHPCNDLDDQRYAECADATAREQLDRAQERDHAHVPGSMRLRGRPPSPPDPCRALSVASATSTSTSDRKRRQTASDVGPRAIQGCNTRQRQIQSLRSLASDTTSCPHRGCGCTTATCWAHLPGLGSRRASAARVGARDHRAHRGGGCTAGRVVGCG